MYDAARREWKEMGLPPLDPRLAPVEISGELVRPPAVAKWIHRGSLESRREEDSREAVCKDLLRELGHLLRNWLPKANETLDAVASSPPPSSEAIRSVVYIAQHFEVQPEALRRQVVKETERLLAPHAPTARELALASILCGADLNLDNEMTVKNAIIKETRAMRRYLQRG
jgi:hypothetical protein